jgi:transposase
MARRKTQSLRVYELKVNCHHTSKETYAKFHQWFKEAKWIENDVIASDEIFGYYYKDHRTVKRQLADKSWKEESLTINTGLHHRILQQLQTDVVNLSKAKKKGRKVGRLKFKSEVNCIPMSTGMIKIKSPTRITIPGFPKLKVYGLDQFDNSLEIADGRIVRKASGIFVKITVCFPKKQPEKTNQVVGLDFGIKTHITDSNGNKMKVEVRESEYLKYLQSKFAGKEKNSKHYWKLRCQIRREYEHLTNKKNDIANKFVHDLKKNNDIIYFQDENLSGWRQYSKGFGCQVQWSSMGRVKAKLRVDEKGFMLSKWAPTTQFCPECGRLNKHSLSERTYRCVCGYSYDRDVHSARNMILFGQQKRMTEWLEQPSVESFPLQNASITSSILKFGKSVEAKKEDSSF